MFDCADSHLNWTLNHIHEWGAPDQNPLKRMFLTRICTLGFAALEISAIAATTTAICCQEAKALCKGKVHTLALMKKPLAQVAKLIAGLAATILVGVIFSPEINFRLHVKLGLAIDNLAAEQEKQQQAKLRSNALATEVEQMREERYARFQEELRIAEEEGKQKNTINPALADLFMHCTTTS